VHPCAVDSSLVPLEIPPSPQHAMRQNGVEEWLAGWLAGLDFLDNVALLSTQFLVPSCSRIGVIDNGFLSVVLDSSLQDPLAI
jgi:hypothetical protein